MEKKKFNIKIIEYKNKNLNILNTIDKEQLNEYSEFPIGSITKVFTAISLLLLHQNKQININNTFEKYLDNKELAKVKIIDVINHVSGMKNIFDNWIYGSSKKKYKCANEVYNDNYKEKEKLITEPKGSHNYSNLGYIILGVLIEKITNEKYIDFIKNNILIPLKMKNTGDEDTNITLYDFNSKILNKYQKIACLRTKYFLFKTRLEFKCKLNNVYFKYIDESYTSKTCSICSNYSNDLGGSKIYCCKECNNTIDRDVNGARNIYIKYYI